MNGRFTGHRRHRGSALMMVITAMATGVVLSTAYVTSRTNGMVVGINLSASSQARVEVESSLALTIAALTSSDRWRTEHRGGLLFERDDDEVSVQVELMDLSTCEAPNETTVDVRAIVTTTVKGIQRIAEADFFVALPVQAGSIDVDLGEFAVFAGDTITVRSDAVIEPWSASPAIARGDPIRVATAGGASGGVRVEGAGAIVSGVEYAADNRSSGSGPLPVRRMPDVVAVPLPAPPEDLAGALFLEEPTGRLDMDVRLDSLELANGEVLELAGNSDLLVEGDLDLSGGATLRITGDSHLVVHGDVRIHDASIVVGETNSLVVHVGGDLDFRHASVTEPGGNAENWVAEIDRIRFQTLMVRETIPQWRIRGRSLVKGELYAPSAEFQLQGRAILIGRVAAQSVLLEGRSTLLYDPTIDDRNGYTALDARAFDEQGDLLGALANLEDLSSESLEAASHDLGIPLASGAECTAAPVEVVEEEDRDHRFRNWWRRPNRMPSLWRGGHVANWGHQRANWSVQIRSIGIGFGR
jgi:hypothetical protein